MSKNINDNAIIQETDIWPPSNLSYFNIRELCEYRHLLVSMIRKSIRIQYNDLYLTLFWTFSRPLAMLAVLRFIKDYSGANMYTSIPYSLYFYSGLILWFYFVEAVSAATKSVEKDVGLMKKIYFPRLLSPIVPIFSNLYTFGMSAVPLVIMILWQGVYPDWKMLLLPFILLQCMLLVMGVGTMFASFSLVSKDAERFLKLSLYLGLFVSPIMYSPERLAAKSKFIYFLNPMAGTLLAFRSCLFGDFPFPLWQWIYSGGFSILLLLAGIKMYRRVEAYFTDLL